MGGLAILEAVVCRRTLLFLRALAGPRPSSLSGEDGSDDVAWGDDPQPPIDTWEIIWGRCPLEA